MRILILTFSLLAPIANARVVQPNLRGPASLASQQQQQQNKQQRACNKKFKNVLVITGGGLSPGSAVGIVAAAHATGNKPDVVIATCGAAIGSVINNSFQNPTEAKKFLLSREFHRYVYSQTHVGQTGTPEIGFKLLSAAATTVFEDRVPNAFDGTVIHVNEKLPRLTPRQDFASRPGETRLITVGARALFGPEDVGNATEGRALYKQTYFTDVDTAKSLKGLPASMKQNFPESPIDPRTEVRTDVSTLQAARASVADPFLMNPAKIGNDYFFAGAMDLFPIETAKAIGCNVVSTTPSGDYSPLEDLAVEKGFGFSQKARVDQLGKYNGVKWIQMKGASEHSMDPQPDMLDMLNKVPADYNEFRRLMEKEYDFAYQRAFDAYEGAPQKKRSRPQPTSRLAQ